MGPASAPRAERKTVTVLSCDLVGFTSSSDGADPEDVRAVPEPISPVRAKGRAQPLRAWLATEIRPLPTISEREARTPFVGRADELARLRAALERAVRGRRARVVAIVGEPGIGKSRLVGELRA